MVRAATATSWSAHGSQPRPQHLGHCWRGMPISGRTQSRYHGASACSSLARASAASYAALRSSSDNVVEQVWRDRALTSSLDGCYLRSVRVILTKLSSARHRFELERDGSARESAELETRSLLLHDFIHYAVEVAAGVSHGFYGRLAAGASLEALSHPAADSCGRPAPADPALLQIEGVVGALTRFGKGQLDVEQMLDAYALIEQSGLRERPAWLDARFLQRVREELRRLTGHWKALRYGESMELHWPPLRGERSELEQA